MNLTARVERLERPYGSGDCPHGYDLRDETEEPDPRPRVVCEVCGLPKRVVRLVNAAD